MSKTFREEMDKITVSDELKAKILKSAEQKIKADFSILALSSSETVILSISSLNVLLKIIILL